MNGLAVEPADGKGRGVFATRDFAEGELIERCPVLIVPGDQAKRLNSTVLARYFFRWIRDTPIVAIPLGYGAIYNHSRTPNAAYHCRTSENWLDFVALSAIRAGEEILVNYGLSPDDPTPRSFEKDQLSLTEA
jgi:SET domain-containing protein